VTLAALVMVIILVGLVLYVVLGGADYGAPIWQVLAGRGPHAEEIREHAHESMAPVWEANHVWLIFVLTVLWTAFPVAFGSIASTLSVALFLAALGIILRGAAYALRAGARTAGQVKVIDMVSAGSSVLAPFALGAAVGGIASGRVPVGNAKGDLLTSWLNPTSIAVGVLAVLSCAYLAAVFLAADAARDREPPLAAAFRRRAMIAGALAGVAAAAGLVALRADARALFDRLFDSAGLVGLIVSAVAGIVVVAALFRGRMEVARFGSAVAVAGVVAGWALAQRPVILPHLTVDAAAAPHDTLVAVLVSIIAGGLILFPSLGLLFRLALGGRFVHGASASEDQGGRRLLEASAAGLRARLAVACAVIGFGGLTIADAGWAHAIGVAAFLAAIALGFVAAVPALLAE
jgi:cytochrome d ubiquinol oxidase subunit II